MKRLAILVFAAPLFLACRDERSITALPLRGDFLDGRVLGGNAHFFFLPPMVSLPTFSGVFNPLIQPVVDICQLDVDPITHDPIACSAGVAHINPFPVSLDPTGDHYQVNWDTEQPQIDVTKFYRIQVFGSPGGLLLGLADIAPVVNGGQLKNVNTGEFIGLVDGRTLPIKFRIEQGAFLGDQTCTDCAEATVTNNGATVVTNTGFAGARLPAGWLALTSPSPVVVAIERVTTLNGLPLSGTNPCVPNALVQVQGCYRFQTIPTATFSSECMTSLCVTVGVCADVPAGTNPDVITLYSVEETGEPVVKELPNVPAPFVTCAGFASAAPRAGWWGNLAGGLWHHLEALVTPTPAYAFHLGAGGSTCCFSRIGWAVPAGTLIDFDVAPGGTALTPGTVINTTYPGVTFSRVMIPGGSLCGSSNTVYVNDNGPLPGGGFGFGSGDNVVTVCPPPTASDFNEGSFGRIQATFSGGATQVCIQVYVTGGPAPATGFLEAFNSGNTILTADTSAANAFGQKLCVSGSISYVQFAGLVGGFAIFDNMVVQFAPPPT